MRRAFFALWIGVFLLFVLSGIGWGQPGDIPLADVLRGSYDMPERVTVAAVMPPTADVLRGSYDVPVVAAMAMPPTADVLRGSYDVPVMAAMAMPPTADVLRGSYDVPVVAAMVMPPTADVLRGSYDVPLTFSPVTFGPHLVPLADVLRGPYLPPIVAAPTPIPWDLVVTGLAVLLLIIALVLDYRHHRRPPVAGGFDPSRPGHVH